MEQKDTQQLTKLDKEQFGLLEKIKSFKIVSPETLQSAVRLTQQANVLQDKWKNFRTYLTGDLYTSIKKKEKDVDPYLKKLKKVVEILEEKMIAWNKQEGWNKEVDGALFKKEPSFEVVSLKDIPVELNGAILIEPHEQNIKKLIKAGIKKIKGIRIFEKDVIEIEKLKSKEDDDI